MCTRKVAASLGMNCPKCGEESGFALRPHRATEHVVLLCLACGTVYDFKGVLILGYRRGEW
jgi:uncharacterized Zn finger protein